jgi:hypothetical protein
MKIYIVLTLGIIIVAIASAAMADTCSDRAVKDTRPVGMRTCTGDSCKLLFDTWVANAALLRRDCLNKSKKDFTAEERLWA